MRISRMFSMSISLKSHSCRRLAGTLAMRTEMDVLVLESFVLLRSEQPPFVDDAKWRDTSGLD